MNYRIQIISTVEEMLPHYALLTQLQPELTYAQYERNLRHMVTFGYRMVLLKVADKTVAISGIWVISKLYCGKYIEMDNVVVDEAERGKGWGKILTDEIVKIGQAEECIVAMLDAYLENKDAHVFYEREGFVKKGYHFIRKIYREKGS